MKNCGEIRENISMYMDNELDAAERKAFEEHIASCEACRHELEDIMEIVSLCRDTEEVELPADFRQKLHEKLVKASDSGKITEIGTGIGKAVKKTRNFRYIASIAAGVVLIFLVGSFYNLGLFNSLKAGGMQANSTADAQISLADSAENAAPAAPAAKKAAPNQAAYGVSADAALSAAPTGETNRSASSSDRETQFTPKMLASDTDAVLSRNTTMTILVDDPAVQLEKVKNMALENGGEEETYTNENSGTSMTLMAKVPSDEIEVTYKIPVMSFDAFKGALDAVYGQANIQPGAIVSEDVTGKVNDLIEKSAGLESQIKKLEAANNSKDAEEIERLKADKVKTDAEIDELRLNSDYTNITLVIKKR